MARHAIDAAAVESSAAPGGARAGVAVKRLHIDDPYAEPKMYLLASVAGANSVRVVWNGQLSIATVFGFAIDLELVELMFTSLLVQATRAAADLGKTSRQARSASFRRAFVTAYASRIGERLRQARVQAETEATSEYGTALVPMLASRLDAVDDAVNEAFPETTRSRPRAVDAHGWRAADWPPTSLSSARTSRPWRADSSAAPPGCSSARRRLSRRLGSIPDQMCPAESGEPGAGCYGWCGTVGVHGPSTANASASPGQGGVVNPIADERLVARRAELEPRADRDRDRHTRSDVDRLLLPVRGAPHLAGARDEVPDLRDRPVLNRRGRLARRQREVGEPAAR